MNNIKKNPSFSWILVLYSLYLNIINTKVRMNIDIFTDASTGGNGSSKIGAGIVFVTDDEHETMLKEKTEAISFFKELGMESYLHGMKNNSTIAEFFAIYRAVCHPLFEASNNAVIYTDSLSVFELMTKNASGKNAFTKNIGNKIETRIQKSGTTVEFRWIPSHSRIVHNEIADKLARRATGKKLSIKDKRFLESSGCIS